jgi:hypothetical protein
MSSMSTEFKHCELTGITGIIVNVLINEELSPTIADQETIKSMVELRLRENNILIFSDKEEAQRVIGDSALYVRDLVVSVEGFRTEYASGELSGEIVYSIGIEVWEFHELNRPIDLPLTIVSVWDFEKFGLAHLGNARAKFKETISEEIDIFINDFFAMNSKSTYMYLERRNK